MVRRTPDVVLHTPDVVLHTSDVVLCISDVVLRTTEVVIATPGLKNPPSETLYRPPAPVKAPSPLEFCLLHPIKPTPVALFPRLPQPAPGHPPRFIELPGDEDKLLLADPALGVDDPPQSAELLEQQVDFLQARRLFPFWRVGGADALEQSTISERAV